MMLGIPDGTRLKLSFSYEPESLTVTAIRRTDGSRTEMGDIREITSLSQDTDYHIVGSFISTRETMYEIEYIIGVFPEDHEGEIPHAEYLLNIE